MSSLRMCLILCLVASLSGTVRAKWVEGRLNTKENWAFLSSFCFLPFEGQFEYFIEFDKDMGIPNLLLYYDDDNQWPAVYHSNKTCKEREAVLNKGQNQIVKLSHLYPETEYSGCVLTKENKELPAAKSSTTSTTQKPTVMVTKNKNNTNSSKPQPPLEPAYYDQFLKSTEKPETTISDNSTTWYELFPTDDLNSTTVMPEDETWESIGPDKNGSRLGNLNDDIRNTSHKNGGTRNENTERLVVSCHNSRRFRSARERWWFIAISNCDSDKGLDVRYKFLMMNGPDGDF